jgi:endogenous inhibitor of DNA gyrase (YacG/DUF329 family)
MTGRPLDPTAARLYRQLVEERLRESACPRCTGSLTGSVITSEDSSSNLEDYPLSDAAQARVLAATVRLVVACAGCGAEVDLDAAPHTRPAAAEPEEPPPLPWAPEAIALYRRGIRERLREATCGGCGAALHAAEVERTVGGTTLDDYALSDEGLARLLAATQHLWVSCPTCGQASELRG